MAMPTTCQWLSQQLCLSYAPRGYARGYVHGFAHKTMPAAIHNYAQGDTHNYVYGYAYDYAYGYGPQLLTRPKN